MQQVVPIMPDEWHHGCGLHPRSFIGPAVESSSNKEKLLNLAKYPA
jgi:hypothetical protein